MYNSVIYGGSGACGRELVKQLYHNDKWENVFVVTRRMIPLFEELKSDPKMHFIQTENIMDLDALTSQIGDKRVDAVFNTLGTRVGKGKELFIKIDKEFVLKSCEYASLLKARYFGHVSSKGTSSKSCFLYLKTKGECEDELKKMDFPNISVYRPGIILNRDNDYRFGEKLASWIPFIDKIKSSDIAKGMIKDAENRLARKHAEGYKCIDHKELANLAK